MTDEILEAVRFRLENDHPVMAAMATKLERVPGPEQPESICAVRLTFDGPALPEKQIAELVFSHADAFVVREQVMVWLDVSEKQIAAAMKKSWLGGPYFGTPYPLTDAQRIHARQAVTSRLSAAERFALTRFRKAQDRGSEIDDYDYRAALDEILADLNAGLTEARTDSVFGV